MNNQENSSLNLSFIEEEQKNDNNYPIQDISNEESDELILLGEEPDSTDNTTILQVNINPVQKLNNESTTNLTESNSCERLLNKLFDISTSYTLKSQESWKKLTDLNKQTSNLKKDVELVSEQKQEIINSTDKLDDTYNEYSENLNEIEQEEKNLRLLIESIDNKIGRFNFIAHKFSKQQDKSIIELRLNKLDTEYAIKILTELTNQKSELDKTQTEYNQFWTEFNLEEKSIKNLTADLQQLILKKKTLITDQQELLDQHFQQLVDLKQKTVDLSHRKTNLESAFNELTDTLYDLKIDPRDLSDYAAQINTFSDYLSFINHSIIDLTSFYDSKGQKINQYNSQIGQVNEHEETSIELKNQDIDPDIFTKLLAFNSELKEKVFKNTQATKIEAFEKELNLYKSQCQQLETRCQEKDAIIKRMQESLDDNEKKQKDLMQQIENNEYQRENEALPINNPLKAKSEEIDRLEKQITQKDEQIDNLNKRIKELNDKILGYYIHEWNPKTGEENLSIVDNNVTPIKEKISLKNRYLSKKNFIKQEYNKISNLYKSSTKLKTALSIFIVITVIIYYVFQQPILFNNIFQNSNNKVFAFIEDLTYGNPQERKEKMMAYNHGTNQDKKIITENSFIDGIIGCRFDIKSLIESHDFKYINKKSINALIEKEINKYTKQCGLDIKSFSTILKDKIPEHKSITLQDLNNLSKQLLEIKDNYTYIFADLNKQLNQRDIFTLLLELDKDSSPGEEGFYNRLYYEFKKLGMSSKQALSGILHNNNLLKKKFNTTTIIDYKGNIGPIQSLESMDIATYKKAVVPYMKDKYKSYCKYKKISVRTDLDDYLINLAEDIYICAKNFKIPVTSLLTIAHQESCFVNVLGDGNESSSPFQIYRPTKYKLLYEMDRHGFCIPPRIDKLENYLTTATFMTAFHFRELLDKYAVKIKDPHSGQIRLIYNLDRSTRSYNGGHQYAKDVLARNNSLNSHLKNIKIDG